MTTEQEIKALFERYLTAWNARDLATVADCYTEPSLFILPDASVPVQDNEAMINLLKLIFEGLEKEDFSHTEIEDVKACACGENLAVADASTVRRLRRDGSEIECIDAHYILRRTKDGWRFTTAVVCSAGWQKD